MSTSVTCDRCKKPITEVAYVLMAVDPDRIDLFHAISRTHLHWECIPTYGRNEQGDEQ